MKLAIVAGEASGDLHASEVVRELKKLDPELRMFGIGGDRLANEGMELLHHAREMGIVGLFNVIRHIPMFRRAFAELVERLANERPDAVLLVDYPDFNLRVARRAKDLGLRVVYYISPQVWAWRRGRVRKIARFVDRMIVIFPFEESFYRERDVPVTYVGHPLVEQLRGVKRDPHDGSLLRIALLPGSRRGEVETLLPAMLEAVAILRREHDIEAWIVQAPTIDRSQIDGLIKKSGIEISIRPHGGESIAAAEVALSSSGTAALECAVVGTPVIVMYKLTSATYLLAKRLVKVPHFSLVNIVGGQKVVPELLQDDVSAERIAVEVRRLIEPETYARVRKELAAVRAKLGEPGASRRAAEAIMSELQS